MSDHPLQEQPLNKQQIPPSPVHQTESRPEEEEEAALISNSDAPPYQPNSSEDVIDPLVELTKNNDVVPLLAVLPRVDLQTIVEGKPLLSRLCTMHLPLEQVLQGRQIKFEKDADNRTALHEAIAADDVTSTYWCLTKKVQNVKDNFGNSPILEAIKLGRRSCFLLCLHYQYYDAMAPHICATYNRTWQLKVLHGMGMDILNARDSRHMTPLETAVHNYSYEVAEFLTSIKPTIEPKQLEVHTDSQAIIRLVNRIKKESSSWNYAVLPIIYFIIHILAMFFISSLNIFQQHTSWINLALLMLVILQGSLYLSAYLLSENVHNQRPDLLQLLRAPEFPPFPEVCPYCLTFPGRDEQHCLKCNTCVPRFHFHSTVCINKNNDLFWFLTQIVWFWLAYSMHQAMYDSLKISSLNIFTFSSSIFFGNAAIIDYLLSSSNYLLLCVFFYLKLFMIYQVCCLIQWISMMVLCRSYQQLNHSDRFSRLYRIARASDGSYKSEQIRLMSNGIVNGLCQGVQNAFFYFFMQ